MGALLAAMAIVLVQGPRIASWHSAGGTASVEHLLAGTLSVATLALAIAIPTALGVASFVTEFAPTPLSRLVSVVLDVAATLPAVVFGLWGLLVVAPIVARVCGVASGRTLLTAGVTLAVMIVPQLAALARDLFARVPVQQREAALAVGATRWEVMAKLVLPQVRLGLIGATALGFARALGETVAVLLVYGHRPSAALSLLEPGATAATAIAVELGPRVAASQASALVGLAAWLFAVTAGVLVAGRLLVDRVAPRVGEA